MANSLYKHIPEGLVHRSKPKLTYLTDTQESVEEIKQHRQEEKEAKTFFKPLDDEFSDLNSQIFTEELHLTGPIPTLLQLQVLAKFWGISNLGFDDHQLTFMFRMLPIVHKIVGNWDLTALCLETILNCNIEIQQSDYHRLLRLEESLEKLGELRLGVDTILGSFIWEEEKHVKIIIGPVDLQFFEEWQLKGKVFQIFQKVCGFLLPLNISFEPEIFFLQSEFVLGAPDEKNPIILGYTSTI